jgi:hypothetical protein
LRTTGGFRGGFTTGGFTTGGFTTGGFTTGGFTTGGFTTGGLTTGGFTDPLTGGTGVLTLAGLFVTLATGFVAAFAGSPRAGWACFGVGAGFAAEVVFAAGGGLVFFWAASASTVVSITAKSIIRILVILALDIFVLLAFS